MQRSRKVTLNKSEKTEFQECWLMRYFYVNLRWLKIKKDGYFMMMNKLRFWSKSEISCMEN